MRRAGATVRMRGIGEMFNLGAYLAERRSVVDAALGEQMPDADCRPPTLHRAMRYAVFSGGKRLRPILCLAAAEAVGEPGNEALPAALAVELLHTYTLVHDDLPCMDDDSLRRGKPTCHVQFGPANAVLTGDALQALAFELAAVATPPPPYRSSRLVTELAGAAGSLGVVGGQAEDITFDEDRGDAETVAFIHRHKTADLFRAALRMDAIAGGAADAQLQALTDYGVNLGLAFQIADDLLDADDARPDPMSCLGIYGLDGARKRATTHIDSAVQSLQGFRPEGAQPLAAIAHYVIERRH